MSEGLAQSMADRNTLSLKCHGYRRQIWPFDVVLKSHAISHLIEDASKGYRVYELFQITRPGDVLKYLWVEVQEVTDRVQESLTSARKDAQPEFRDHLWPENHLPYVAFDSHFYWLGIDDSDPEDNTWHDYKCSQQHHQYIGELFQSVRLAQKSLRQQDDVLIQHELKLIDGLEHDLDLLPKTPLDLTNENYTSITQKQYPDSYYEKLASLLDDEVIAIEIAANKTDYETMRIVCERQRARCNETGKKPGEALKVSTTGWDWQNNYSICWGADVHFHIEGLGPANILVAQFASVKHLYKGALHFYLPYPAYLGIVDEGEIEGYDKEAGEGWCLYKAKPGTKTLDVDAYLASVATGRDNETG